MLYADGYGGLSAESLEIYFGNENKGQWLDEEDRSFVRQMIPALISEDRKIQAEKAKK